MCLRLSDRDKQLLHLLDRCLSEIRSTVTKFLWKCLRTFCFFDRNRDSPLREGMDRALNDAPQLCDAICIEKAPYRVVGRPPGVRAPSPTAAALRTRSAGSHGEQSRIVNAQRATVAPRRLHFTLRNDNRQPLLQGMLTIVNGESNVSLHRILSCHWLL
jgi:hypothetical protein